MMSDNSIWSFNTESTMSMKGLQKKKKVERRKEKDKDNAVYFGGLNVFR